MSFWDKLKKRWGYKEKKRAAVIGASKATAKVAAKMLASEAEEFLFGDDKEEELDPEEQARQEARAAKERAREEKRRRKEEEQRQKEEARKAAARASDIERELAELKKRAGKE